MGILELSTMHTYTEYLLNHAIMTAIFFGIGKLMQRSIGAKSEARRTHGRYVFRWMIGSFGLGGALAPLFADGPYGPGGFAMFCMLCGWVIGMIHGGLMILFKPEIQAYAANKAQYKPTAFKAAWISFACVLPIIIPVLIVLRDVDGWGYLLSNFGISELMIALLVVWFVYFFAELIVRVNTGPGYRKVPWFSVFVGLAFVSIFSAADWAKPIVSWNPHWSRVHQKVTWKVAGNRIFTLTIDGPGNTRSHQFTSATLVWKGNAGWLGFGAGQVDAIDFHPMRFGTFKDYKTIYTQASAPALRQHIRSSGLTTEELDELNPMIWDVLQQVEQGAPISSTRGIVGPLLVSPRQYENIYLGAWIWVIGLIVLFQFVGQWTLRQPMQLDSTHLV